MPLVSRYNYETSKNDNQFAYIDTTNPNETPSPEQNTQALNKTVDNTNKFVCPTCQKVLKTNNILAEHIRNVHSGLWYECSENKCAKLYKKRGALSTHVQKTHNRKLTAAEKAGAKKSNLKITAKKFGCHTCNQRFTRNSSLKLHIKETHMETDTKFECYICQSTIYSNYRNIKKHFSSKHCENKKQR